MANWLRYCTLDIWMSSSAKKVFKKCILFYMLSCHIYTKCSILSHSFLISIVSLLPLIFILCLEPLTEAIWSHPNLHGVSIRHKEYMLSLFTDDILLTLTDPHIFLQTLQKLLSTFGSLSDLKINTTKTEALPIHYLSTLLSSLQMSYLYHWCSNSCKYLGSHITFSNSTLYIANYPSLFQEISYMLKQ